jgi:agmatine/peptidylarginine deiminase
MGGAVKRIAAALLGGALGVLAGAGSASASAHTDREIERAREGALPSGVLPVWEMRAERLESRDRADELPKRPAAPVPYLAPPEGFRVPAEFEPVAAFIVSQGDWLGDRTLVDLIVAGTGDGGASAIVLSRADPSSFAENLSARGADPETFHVVRPPDGVDAKWARDFSPISVYEPGPNGDGRLGFVDPHYYDRRSNDDAIPGVLAELIGVPRFGLEGDDEDPADEHRLYLEGGNYMTDGAGTCIMSNDVPDDNRGNPDADTFEKAEALLAEYLGCEEVIWLKPVPNTSTGHVDLYAKLLTPVDVLVIDFPDQSGNNAAADPIVDENAAVLEAAGFDVHRITVPSLGAGVLGWTYKTYTNSVMLNSRILVPTYGAPEYDAAALDLYAEILGAGYTVVGIDSSRIAAQGGAVHCTTMQIAASCGDGVRENLLEECEGDDLGGATCETLGLGTGGLACDDDCRFDVSGCSGEVERDAGRPPRDAGVDAAVSERDAGVPDAGPVDGGFTFGEDGSCDCSTTGGTLPTAKTVFTALLSLL